MMEGLGVAANVIAVIDLSAKVGSLCVQYAMEVKNAAKDIKRLHKEVSNLKRVAGAVQDLLNTPDGEMLDRSQRLKINLDDSQLLLKKLELKLTPRTARKVVAKIGINALKWPFQSKEVNDLVEVFRQHVEAIDHTLQVEQTRTLIRVGRTILSIDQRTALSRLSVAEGASFDSRAEEHSPTCLPNTRIELLDQISKWVDDPSGKAIFWLNGMAGTGKSTISRTFARSQSRIGCNRLGASFFFKRGEPDRGNLSKFMTIITRQLVEREPSLAPIIKEVIEADSTLPRSAVQEQFTKFIFEPLSKISRTVPILVVVDALDECDNDKDIRLLINLFSRTQPPQSSRLRVFVTSRPELPIRLGFSDIKGAYRDLILYKIPLLIIERDISAFLEHKLRAIRDDYNASVEDEWKLPIEWPAQSDTKALVDMAVPLFIFAATACRFISERRCGSPDMQLQRVLEYKGATKLDATYMPVLDQQIVGLSLEDRDNVIRQFRHIIGTIIVLESPLPIAALAQLLGIPQKSIKVRLDHLHSVLNVPTSQKSSVRLLHLSFRDFLVDPARRDTNPFWINEKQMHQQTAEGCLRIMGEHLRSDICNIRAPGTLRSALDHQLIEECLSPELQYCCLFWIYHLQQADVQASDGERVYKFLLTHLLHWLETLSLMGRASESLNLLKTLQTAFKFDKSREFLDLLDDAIRFILAYTSTIDSTPLQIYSSLVAFSPEKSKIRTAFGSGIPRWVSVQTNLEINWGSCLQTLEGHSDSVNAVAFSHDPALLASASSDRTIRLWRPDTGECIQTLEGHRDSVRSVAFSHDSALLASASHDQTIRLWRPDTGECIQTLEGHSDLIDSIAFSHDSALLASASSDETIRLWRPDTGECVQTLEGHSSWVTSVAFSHDSALLASASSDGTIRLWRPDTGECVQTLEGHSDWVNALAFSHDSALLASASIDGTIRLWRPDTGECVQTLEGHSRSVNAVAFSHDSALLASASYDQTIRLWRPDTGECIQTLEGHSDLIDSIAFSHDSALLASASHDKTIRLWRPDTGKCVQTLEGHSDWVNAVAFSHDSALLASASHDKTIRLWRPDTGECTQTLEGHRDSVRSVAFSHNSALLASASSDGTIQLWRPDTGECVQTLEGHSSWVTSVAFSHDSALLASASSDKTIQLWRPDTGECVQNINVGVAVSWLSFKPGDQEILTDVGALAMHAINPTSSTNLPHPDMLSHRSGCGVSIDRCWITWNGENLLWLPKQYRRGLLRCSAISGPTVVIGCNSGKVLFVNLASEELPGVLRHV